MTHNTSRDNVLDLNGLLELMAATRMQCSSIWTLYLSLHHLSITTLKFSPRCSLNLKFLRDKNMLKQIPSFVVIGTKAASCKNSLALRDYTLPLTRMFLRRKSWKNDVFRALSTRLDKCNDIQMSRIILCLWGAWSNWILIKYWVRETYLIMQAVPLVFLSGELQSAEQNGLCELVGGSRKRMPMLQSNIANTCANN